MPARIPVSPARPVRRPDRWLNVRGALRSNLLRASILARFPHPIVGVHMPVLPRLATAVLALALALPASAGVQEDERARNSLRVLQEIQAIPESGIPAVMFDEAKAIVVIPDTLKIGLVLGGRRGHGLLSVKTPEGTWSNPAFVKLTGGSIGFQAGVQSSDVVLAFTT